MGDSIPVSELRPNAENPRAIGREELARLAESIRRDPEFMRLRPIVVDALGEILGGNQRFRACVEELGLETLPADWVARVEDLDDEKRKRFILVDNAPDGMSGVWNWDLLAEHFNAEDLDALGFDLGKKFDTPAPGKTDADEVPGQEAEELEPESVPGTVYQLGPHRILCGDSTDPEQVKRLFNGAEGAQLLHADPPYGMGFESEGVANDNLYEEKLADFQESWWRVWRPYLADNASAYVWGWEDSLFDFYLRLRGNDADPITKRNYIIWNKGSGQGMTQESLRRFAPVTEHCLFFMLGTQGFNNNADHYWEGWEPLRVYLKDEMVKAGWTVKDLNEITETQMGGHWVTKSQWNFPTKANYEKLQKAANGAAFCKSYKELKAGHAELAKGFDELRKEFYEGRAYFDNTHDSMTDVWDFKRVQGEERHGHATPKPVAMIARALKSSCPEGGLVLEPFLGSGSTLIAAQQCRRVCYGAELDPKYCDTVRKRWSAYVNGPDADWIDATPEVSQ